jgi:hypothetical protein
MIVKFTSFIFLALAITACAKHRSVPLSIQCDEDIKQATKSLNVTVSELDKALAKKIENLIEAAKIQQQHEMYPSCIDKAQRALTLLKTDKRATTNKN